MIHGPLVNALMVYLNSYHLSLLSIFHCEFLDIIMLNRDDSNVLDKVPVRLYCTMADHFMILIQARKNQKSIILKPIT